MELPMSGSWILLLISGTVVGFVIGWVFRQFLGQKKLSKATQFAEKYIEDAKAESENVKKTKLLEAKEEAFQLKQEIENQVKNKQGDLQRQEKHLSNRELNLDRKVDVLNKKENALNQLENKLKINEEQLKKQEVEFERLVDEENKCLEQISGLTTEQAKEIQMKNMLERAKEETSQSIHEMREEAKKQADTEAKEIIMQALQRSPINHIVDTTVSIVKLPDDEMKGRIIGREGRNIRAFESATGIEVLIDDTPQTVVLSGFDPIRRQVAKQSMEKLIYDGRIHPGRIEEVVEKSYQEIKEKMAEIGEQTLHEIGIHGVEHELLRLLGKQQYRVTYGQNLLQHSKEVAMLAGEMASLLGLDSTLAKRAGLFHDIGKTAEDYSNAPFYEIGVELAKKFGENEVVQEVIRSQGTSNDTTGIFSPITILVKIANGISVSRPGAQKEMLENYVKRMHKLEEISKSFTGVVSAYAIQAGKEVRVIVDYTTVDDKKARGLADSIVSKLKKEMEFSGQLKVSVIREFRAVDYAK